MKETPGVETETIRMSLCNAHAMWAAAGSYNGGGIPGTCSILHRPSLPTAREDQVARRATNKQYFITSIVRDRGRDSYYIRGTGGAPVRWFVMHYIRSSRGVTTVGQVRSRRRTSGHHSPPRPGLVKAPQRPRYDARAGERSARAAAVSRASARPQWRPVCAEWHTKDPLLR